MKNFPITLATDPGHAEKQSLAVRRLTDPAFRKTHDEILRLLALPRCMSCTESSNVGLSHAVDSANFSPSPETLARLEKAIEGDKEWNPHHWTA